MGQEKDLHGFEEDPITPEQLSSLGQKASETVERLLKLGNQGYLDHNGMPAPIFYVVNGNEIRLTRKDGSQSLSLTNVPNPGEISIYEQDRSRAYTWPAYRVTLKKSGSAWDLENVPTDQIDNGTVNPMSDATKKSEFITRVRDFLDDVAASS